MKTYNSGLPLVHKIFGEEIATKPLSVFVNNGRAK